MTYVDDAIHCEDRGVLLCGLEIGPRRHVPLVDYPKTDVGGSYCWTCLGRRPALPTDQAWPWLDADSLALEWDDGVEGEIRDASRVKRATAISAYASEASASFTEVRCVVRYVVLHTRQDVWDGPGKDRWADDLRGDAYPKISFEDAYGQVPDEPPADWKPEDGMACWSVCAKDHPRAIRVYMMETRGEDRIPDQPPLLSSVVPGA